MKGRDRSLAKAQSLVESGLSVDVVGSRGSGRTAFMQALAERLEENSWTVRRVRGVASLKQNPFAAIALSGIAELTPTRRIDAVIEDVGRQLTEQVTNARCAYFLDDWDDLDEVSWGVIEYVRRTTGVPIVISRLQGLRARHTPSGLPSSTLSPTYVIDMLPLRFEDLDAVMSEYLGASLESGTSRRLYTKTGGNVGLALSLIDATVREGRLVQIDGNLWTATGELWSPALRAVMEMHLESLDPASRDALETIAMVGLVDVETVRTLVDWPTLELLEERAMIAFAQGTRSNYVSVVPPLFTSYFRHDPLSARRIRLTEKILSTLGSASSNLELDHIWNDANSGGEKQDALFAGMLRESLKTRQLVAAYEWEKNPNVHTANAYVDILTQAGVAASGPSIERVFSETDGRSGDIASRAEYYAKRADWLAYGLGQVDEAVTFLESHARELSSHGRMLDARRISILADFRSVPAGFEIVLEVTDDLPVPVQTALLEAQLRVLIIAGRLVDGNRVYEELRRLDPQGERASARSVQGISLLAQGAFEAGSRDLNNGLDEARGNLDIHAFRAFAGGMAYAHLHSGDMRAHGELLDVALSTGELAPVPPGSRTSILVSACILAAARGQVALCNKYAALLRSENTADLALPGQSAAWAEAQVEILEGESGNAADTIWDASAELRERGAVFAAQLGMLASLEMKMDEARLTETLALLEQHPDTVVLGAQGRYLSAAARGDANEMLAAADVLAKHHRIGMAASAYGRAADLFAEDQKLDLRDEALLSERKLRTQYPGRTFNTTRFGGLGTALSKREKEVASLAVNGLSNHEIATRLVVSVRTVDSHMYRIMRKLGVPSRDALGAKLGSGDLLN
ncbi:helix-turn-helix transcriptional regulator [Leucobacter sp. NPDC077196]|uniref:helix-turn-helix transcriptional regulator n=1 Tax=Leucobacter sp. NPDC077196 TaxID=3154959 RepID=UPI00343CFA14